MNTNRTSAYLSTVAGIFLVGGFALWGCGSDNNTTPSGLPNGPATQAQVLRGRYLVIAGGCSDCHNRGVLNPNDPNWLAGYIPNPPAEQGKFQVAALTIYAANLTPDVQTGLGSWTARDIFNALRNGKDKEGNFLCPPMPWPSYRNLTDDDIYAIAAYLQSLKPVSNTVPEATGPGVPAGQHPDCSIFYTNLPSLPPYPGTNETQSR